ncbi:GxxExxY protein [Candidatus Parcubacteria bacterium]|nr:GxxExxY protein [Candidatus Parcubacteria bacterium]
MAELLYKQESYIIQGVAFDIYKQFRNRHKEKVYQNSFYLGLKNKSLAVEKEKRIDILYNNKKVGTYIPDLVVNNIIFIELKVKPNLIQEDIKQFWYYLKVSGYKLGYLINFGMPDGVQIIRRIYGSKK